MTDQYTAQRAHRDYIESQLEASHPVEIVYGLYQVAIDNVRAAIAHLKSGNAFARANAVTKAEFAVDELILCLDRSVDAPFIKTLDGLYGYVLRQIVAGHSKKSEKAFREALSILTTLSEGWGGVKDQVCGSAVSPAAYAQSSSAPVGSRDWSL